MDQSGGLIGLAHITSQFMNIVSVVSSKFVATNWTTYLTPGVVKVRLITNSVAFSIIFDKKPIFD